MVGIKDRSEDHFKLPGIGLNSPVKDEGQLAWLLAISDFLLSDEHLKWDEYADTIGDGDIASWGHGHFDIEMNRLWGVGDDISELRRDTMSISPLFTGADDRNNKPEVTAWTKNNLLDEFDDYAREWSELSFHHRNQHHLIDSVQRKIVDYINERKGLKVSDYIKKRYEVSDKPYDAPLNKKPVLKLVVWGLGVYDDIWNSMDGEIFVYIRCTNKGLSDFQSVPSLVIPKRILRTTDYEELTKHLYKSYIRHKVELKIITKLLKKIEPQEMPYSHGY